MELRDGPEEIAANIVRLRKQKRLSQSDLAAMMRAAGAGHWRQTTVSRVETGKQALTWQDVQALEAVLGDVTGGEGAESARRDAAASAEGALVALRLQALERDVRSTMEALEGVLVAMSEIRVGLADPEVLAADDIDRDFHDGAVEMFAKPPEQIEERIEKSKEARGGKREATGERSVAR